MTPGFSRSVRAHSPLWAMCAVLVALGAGAPQPVAADETPTFTFKRIGVGQQAAGSRRITVQIDPEEQARILAANPAVPQRPEVPHDERPAPVAQPDGSIARVGTFAWYWDLIGPGREAASSGRLESAVAALSAGPGGQNVPAPRLASLQRIADTYGAEILTATAGRGVSPALALAVIAVESAGKPDAVSHAGAGGLMQLMPATAERFGVSDRMDPSANVRGGVAYLEWLLNHFEKDVLLALAGYNAGEGAVAQHDGVPPFRETRDYVPKVLAAWEVARGLCLTRPQLVSDGCVFRQGVQVAQGD
ncbi:MAG: lytic transglycosylase domain-containing protein [Pseudomonadota bacterium]